MRSRPVWGSAEIMFPVWEQSVQRPWAESEAGMLEEQKEVHCGRSTVTNGKGTG